MKEETGMIWGWNIDVNPCFNTMDEAIFDARMRGMDKKEFVFSCEVKKVDGRIKFGKVDMVRIPRGMGNEKYWQ